MRLTTTVLVRILVLAARGALAITGIVLVRQRITAYQHGWYAPLGGLILAALTSFSGWVAPILIIGPHAPDHRAGDGGRPGPSVGSRAIRVLGQRG